MDIEGVSVFTGNRAALSMLALLAWSSGCGGGGAPEGAQSSADVVEFRSPVFDGRFELYVPDTLQ